MYKAKIAGIVAVVALTFLPGSSWAVTNAVVGTCKAGTQFTTIQAAVNAATAGTTVSVCPGTYPEQVTILKNLTLQGISPTSIGAAIIVPPAAGVKVNAASSIWQSLAAQLLVQQATTVTVKNIEVDGGGQATCTGGFNWVGILFQGPGGTITNSAVRNAPTCVTALGILADAIGTAMHVTNNSLSDCYSVCLEADFDSNLVATGNMVTATISSGYGIQVQQAGGPNVITGNTVAGNFTYGASVFRSSSVTMTGNTVLIGSAGENVGIFLGGASHNSVQNNRISGGFEAFYIDDMNSAGGNVVTNNTVSNEVCAMLLVTTTGDTLTPNTYLTTNASACI